MSIELDLTEEELSTLPQKQASSLFSIERKAPAPKKKDDGPASVPDSFTVVDDCLCMLTLTDVAYGQKGHNKFYVIQFLTKNGSYFLRTVWGRVGVTSPPQDIKEFSSRLSAFEAFKSKFHDKTSNSWDHRASFKQVPGKYSLISLQNSKGRPGESGKRMMTVEELHSLVNDRIKRVESKMPRGLKELMEAIWDTKRMGRTLRELHFDTEKMPLGKLSMKEIQIGYAILTEVQNKMLKKGKSGVAGLVDLTNQFYTHIPHDYGMRRPPLIDSFEMIKEKTYMLDVLKEINVANNYIRMAVAASPKNGDEQNPLDAFYSMLNCDIEQIGEDDLAFKAIQEMVSDGNGPTHKFTVRLKKVFAVSRRGENIRFRPFNRLPNKRMLWHGTRLTNYVGILTEGLRIAPPDAPATGYMFGKGIYTSSLCTKSAAYCRPSSAAPSALLLLCRVALGNSFELSQAKTLKRPPGMNHSVHAIGNLLPSTTKSFPGLPREEEASYACGNLVTREGKNASALNYEEFVVYDEGQVEIKYLVEVECVFQNKILD